MKTSVLAGRGGAGFPTGLRGGRSCHAPSRRQVRCLQLGRSGTRYLQRPRLLRLQPHSVIEGMAIAAYAMGANAATTTFTAKSGKPLLQKVDERRARRAAGLSRPEHSWFRASISSCSHITATAPTSAAKRPRCSSRSGKEGSAALQTAVPGLTFGLYGKPTTIQQYRDRRHPVHSEHGRPGSWKPANRNNGGTKLFSISVTSNRPGNCNSAQHRFSTLLEMAGGCAVAASLGCIPGGPSAPTIPGDDHDGHNDGL